MKKLFPTASLLLFGLFLNSHHAASTSNVPINLKAERSGNNVILTWDAPAYVNQDGGYVTETFESYEPWTYKNFGDWKLIDADNSEIGEINGVDIPNMKLFGKASFILMDNKHENLEKKEDELLAVSGHQFIAAFCLSNYNLPTDDWLISPLLSGKSQKISLMARSYKNYHESFKVLISSAGRELVDFSPLDEAYVEQVPFEWTKYEFDIPAGTRYFAVNSSTDNNWVLMIDDIRYQPSEASHPDDVPNKTPCGYFVYRNGVRINSVPVEEFSFLDENVPAGMLRYEVTAITESDKSDAQEIDTGTGVKEMGYSNDFVEVLYNGLMLKKVGTAYAVCDMSGRVVREGRVNDDKEIVKLAQGLYVVYVGGKSCKVRI